MNVTSCCCVNVTSCTVCRWCRGLPVFRWFCADLLMLLCSWCCSDLALISWSCFDLALSWSCFDLNLISIWSLDLALISWSRSDLLISLWSFDLALISWSRSDLLISLWSPDVTLISWFCSDVLVFLWSCSDLSDIFILLWSHSYPDLTHILISLISWSPDLALMYQHLFLCVPIEHVVQNVHGVDMYSIDEGTVNMVSLLLFVVTSSFCILVSLDRTQTFLVHLEGIGQTWSCTWKCIFPVKIG